MSLRELRDAYPTHFYPQTWYEGEAFMDAAEHSMPLTFPDILHCVSDPPSSFDLLPSVLQMAYLYLFDPHHRIWANYVWCRDVDAQGQRCYVGTNGKGFEIHRHLRISDRWVFPVWS